MKELKPELKWVKVRIGTHIDKIEEIYVLAKAYKSWAYSKSPYYNDNNKRVTCSDKCSVTYCGRFSEFHGLRVSRHYMSMKLCKKLAYELEIKTRHYRTPEIFKEEVYKIISNTKWSNYTGHMPKI